MRDTTTVGPAGRENVEMPTLERMVASDNGDRGGGI